MKYSLYQIDIANIMFNYKLTEACENSKIWGQVREVFSRLGRILENLDAFGSRSVPTRHHSLLRRSFGPRTLPQIGQLFLQYSHFRTPFLYATFCCIVCKYMSYIGIMFSLQKEEKHLEIFWFICSRF